MNVLPGEYIIIPGVGRCTVIAQDGNRRIAFESPRGTKVSTGALDLMSTLWADFEREVEQELGGGHDTDRRLR
jgi:hypothetical protein